MLEIKWLPNMLRRVNINTDYTEHPQNGLPECQLDIFELLWQTFKADKMGGIPSHVGRADRQAFFQCHVGQFMLLSPAFGPHQV